MEIDVEDDDLIPLIPILPIINYVDFLSFAYHKLCRLVTAATLMPKVRNAD